MRTIKAWSVLDPKGDLVTSVSLRGSGFISSLFMKKKDAESERLFCSRNFGKGYRLVSVDISIKGKK